jgi:hypothetical protein
VSIYSANQEIYLARVHQNGRLADQAFDRNECLFRRYPAKCLVNGRAVSPLAIAFEANSGISVNRGKYSEPCDVLEPDCCNGSSRVDCVVLNIHCSDVPEQIPTTDGSGRIFRFRPFQKPLPRCFPHSEIWCNEQGDIGQEYQEPPKHIKNLFRGELAQRLATRDVLECNPRVEGVPG